MQVSSLCNRYHLLGRRLAPRGLSPQQPVEPNVQAFEWERMEKECVCVCERVFLCCRCKRDGLGNVDLMEMNLFLFWGGLDFKTVRFNVKRFGYLEKRYTNPRLYCYDDYN